MLTTALLFACGPNTLARQRDSIVGGVAAPDDKSVVRLSTGCAGTVIAPRTVVSAAPCLNVAPGTAVTVSTDAGVFEVETTWVHPLWRSEGRPSLSVALTRLPLDVPPVPWNERISLVGLEGEPVRLVGFGAVGLNDATPRQRRTVTTSLSTFTSTGLMVGTEAAGACEDDVGGAMLMRFDGGPETLVGVLSLELLTCGTANGDRLDLQASALLDLLESHEVASCARERKCVPGCTPPDLDCFCIADGTCNPDCPGLDDPDCGECARNGRCSATPCPGLDADCTPLGGRCTRDEACASRRCINDVQNPDRYCSAACLSPADCTNGLVCLGGACTKRQLPAVAAGAECTPGESWCLDNTVCARVDAGQPFCARVCTSALACLTGQRCEDSSIRGRRVCAQAMATQLQVPAPALPAAPRSGCTSSAWALLPLTITARRRRARPAATATCPRAPAPTEPAPR
jgi:hypothetical protein